MIESLHLRKKMREKSFFRMPGNTVYNRELPDDLGRVLIRWPIRRLRSGLPVTKPIKKILIMWKKMRI